MSTKEAQHPQMNLVCPEVMPGAAVPRAAGLSEGDLSEGAPISRRNLLWAPEKQVIDLVVFGVLLPRVHSSAPPHQPHTIQYTYQTATHNTVHTPESHTQHIHHTHTCHTTTHNTYITHTHQTTTHKTYTTHTHIHTTQPHTSTPHNHTHLPLSTN